MIPIVEKYLEVSQRKGFESKAELKERDFNRWIGLALKAHEKRLNFTKDAVGQIGFGIYSGKTHVPFFAKQKSGQCKSTLQRGITSKPCSEGPSSQRVKSTNAGQGVEKREPCYTDGGNVNYQRPLWRSVWCFLKHLKNRATEHTALPLMGVYLGKTKTRQDTGTPTLTAALFTRASTWVQLKCPWKEKLDKEDLVLMYNGTLLSPEINEIRPVAATRGLTTVTESEISQTK